MTRLIPLFACRNLLFPCYRTGGDAELPANTLSLEPPNIHNNLVALFSYYIALPFIYLLSLLPFRALYFVSDIFYLVLYHIIGYRRKIVFNNLRNSFPDKSDAEIKALSKRFYH